MIRQGRTHQLGLVFSMLLCMGSADIKCFDYEGESNPETGSAEAESPMTDDPPDPGPEAEGAGDEFVPAVACEKVGQARFVVANFAYNVECGCLEPAGRTCTVPVGTSVVWTFADSEEHNITSVASTFGMSPDNLSGEFEYTFQTAGRFDYGCTLHPNDMSGYSIVVQ